MNDWLTPEGLMALVTLLGLVLSLLKNLAQARGRQDLAARLDQAQATTVVVSNALGTVVKGVEKAKGRMDPKSVTQLVATLREEHVAAGVEEVVKPVLAEVRDGATPVEAVRAATTRLERTPTPPQGTPLSLRSIFGLGAVLLACVVGCVPVEAVEQAREEAAIAHGHALDASLPLPARQIGADNERAWRAQHVALDGRDVPGAERWAPLPPELAPLEGPR